MRKILCFAVVLLSSAVPSHALVQTPAELYKVNVQSYPTALGEYIPGLSLFVANAGSGSVSMIDETSGNVVATTPVGPAPQGIAIDQLRARVYVALGEANKVVVLNARTGAKLLDVTIPQCTGPTFTWGIAVDQITNTVFVTCYSANILVAFNGTSGVISGSVPTGAGPLSLVLYPPTGRLYMSQIGTQEIRVIDGHNLQTVASISRGIAGGVWGLAIDPITGRVFAANFLTGTIQVILGTRLLNTYAGFTQPQFISFDPVYNLVWVASQFVGPRVSAIDPSNGDVTIVALTGTKPIATATSPVLGYAFTGNTGDLSVSVISEGIAQA